MVVETEDVRLFFPWKTEVVAVADVVVGMVGVVVVVTDVVVAAYSEIGG